MNTNMYHNAITQENLNLLRRHQFEVIAPDQGLLACGDIGDGKMPREEVLVQYILREIAYEKDMEGLKVLVTAGPTQESIDPVRYITNHSTGKMGYEVARACMLRGAQVTLVSGVTTLEAPPFIEKVDVKSAQDMFEAVEKRFLDQDIIIKSAAVADYKPCTVSDNKMKKSDGEMSIPLDRTIDILKYIGERRREGQFYCGFSMETQNMLENSRAKLDKKNIDLIVANNLKVAGSGFGTDTNVVTLISREAEIQLDLMSKEEVAHRLLDQILKMRAKKHTVK
ncbi:MAG: bifunctional phosphopantothenoylcysteine decarboxylase/phosphopantothenate--cysteine ligase CoaBC, partial [Epulopiscium sp.]|nr:bifunctional phosphopantothenoylcysteine decarboxylase/phosphopantothenate--cysteine ligase CoaBC [Candidatus Epulonipiscium sp.]